MEYNTVFAEKHESFSIFLFFLKYLSIILQIPTSDLIFFRHSIKHSALFFLLT